MRIWLLLFSFIQSFCCMLVATISHFNMSVQLQIVWHRLLGKRENNFMHSVSNLGHHVLIYKCSKKVLNNRENREMIAFRINF